MLAQKRQETEVCAGLGTAAEDDGADGASGFGIGNGNVAAAGLFVDGHFGNQRDAHSGAYHTEQTGKLSAFKDNLRVDAGAIAGSDCVFAETMSIAKQEEGILADILKGDGAAFGKLVFLWKDGEERFGEKREGFEFVATKRKRENGEVDGTGAEALEKDGCNFFDYAELSLREFSREVCEDAGEEIGRDCGNGANSDGAADRTFLFDHVAASGFKFTQDAACPGQKCLSNFRKTHGAAEAVEEACAELIFQFENLLRERRLGDVGLFGGAGERARVGDGAKVAKLVEFDTAVISRQSSVLSKRSFL